MHDFFDHDPLTPQQRAAHRRQLADAAVAKLRANIAPMTEGVSAEHRAGLASANAWHLERDPRGVGERLGYPAIYDHVPEPIFTAGDDAGADP